jgi:hypothetical protein
MELIQKEARYNRPIKADDTIRWPFDSKVVQFLAKAESAYSISELINVRNLLLF